MFEKFLHQTPFLRLLVPFLFGILLQIAMPGIRICSSPFIACLFILIIISEYFKITYFFAINRIWGITLTFILFTIGGQLVKEKQNRNPHLKNSNKTFIAKVKNTPIDKKMIVKTELEVLFIKDSTKWTNKKFNLLAYFPKEEKVLKLKAGNYIIANSYIKEIDNNKNPYAFNYKRYLRYKEVYYNTFLNSDSYQLLSIKRNFSIFNLAENSRQFCIDIFKRYHISGDELNILSALSLGYKDTLSTDLKENFSTSGVIHILAVSGLHVGIIFFILSKVLFFLQRNRYGKFIEYGIIIIVLVFYAFLTGLSSSVCRSTLMFIIVCFGKMLTRQTYIYNSICASALLLLWYNPYYIMDAGFQLSYIAVISIVFFQPRIYSLFSFNFFIPDYLWKLSSVTLAAQIGTLPFTIFYFNQFPLYFIFSNLVAIPLVTIILYSTFVLLVFSFCPFIANFLSKVVLFFTSFLNKTTIFFQALPSSKIVMNVDTQELIIISLFISIIAFFIITKRSYFFRLSLFIMLFFSMYKVFRIYEYSKKRLIAIHHVNGCTALNFIDKLKSTLIFNKDKLKNQKILNQNIYPLLRKYRIKNIQMNNLKDQSSYFNHFYFNGRRIILLNSSELLKFKAVEKLKTDYIILSENVNMKISNLKDYFNFDKIIFDSSNSYDIIKQWEKECKYFKLDFYNVKENGAYIEHI